MTYTRMLLIGAAAVAAGATQAALADPAIVHGEAKELGDGSAQIYAELDAEGAPRVIGGLDQSMLQGLPDMPNTWSRCFDKNTNGRSTTITSATATMSPRSRCRRSWRTTGPRRSSG